MSLSSSLRHVEDEKQAAETKTSTRGLSSAELELLQCFDQHVEHVFKRDPDSVEFHLSDNAPYDSFLRDCAHKAQFPIHFQRFSYQPSVYRPEACVKNCSVLVVHENNVDKLWGSGSYHLLVKVHFQYKHFHSMSYLMGELEEAAKHRRDWYQQLLRLQETSSFPLFQALMAHNVPEDEVRLKSLIHAASQSTLDHTLASINLSQMNPVLQSALREQSSEICSDMIKRMTPIYLQKIMWSESHENWTPMHDAVKYQPPELCLELLKNVTDADVYYALRLVPKNSNNLSLLNLVAYHQSAPVFTALVTKCSSDGLAVAVSVFGILYSARYQPAHAFQVLLQKLNNPAAKAIINGGFGILSFDLQKAFSCVARYQSAENCELFLSFLDQAHQKNLLETCNREIYDASLRLARRALQVKMKSDVVEKKAEPQKKFIMQLINSLQEYDKTFPILERKGDFKSEDEVKAIQLFDQGAFVKIIRDDKKDDHQTFIEHLFKPQKRQVIRDKEKNKYGIKMLLSPQQEKKEEKKSAVVYSSPDGFPTMVQARSEEERKQHKKTKKKYTETIKHPVSFVSMQKQTVLFGYESGRKMVGYAFRVNPYHVKLCSLHDCGTFTRWWHSHSRNELYGIVGRVQNLICKSFAEFVNRVDQQPYVVNEVLVKLNLQDLFAIVIAYDTKAAREIAIKRRNLLKHAYHKSLPILFYHAEQQKTAVYSSAEQRHDHLYLFLSDLADTIQEQCTATFWVASLFGKKIQITVKDRNYAIDANTAKQILDTIGLYINDPKKAFDEINFILKKEKISPSPQHSI